MMLFFYSKGVFIILLCNKNKITIKPLNIKLFFPYKITSEISLFYRKTKKNIHARMNLKKTCVSLLKKINHNTSYFLAFVLCK
jgi:hypothetical protein